MMDFFSQALEVLRHYVVTVYEGKNNEASRALGFKDPSILSQWLNGTRKPSLRILAPALDIIGARIVGPDEKMESYELVKKVVAKAGAGSSLITSDEVDGLYAFRSDFFGRNNLSAEKCILLEVFGDSMRPTLENDDLILVDTTDTRIVDGKIFLVALGDELLVKRIFRAPSGILLRSDNKDFPDMPVPAADLASCVVHGRVRWCGKTL